MARVDAPVARKITNVGDADAVYVIVGAEGGYVGRDGLLPRANSASRPTTTDGQQPQALSSHSNGG